ncbi:MAG: class I SAM-dependent methyltransferase [Ignavibacteriales bacterium]|nr:class I SAM-dependent methyltransferase [Ignavibacteriales bacterium]
MKEQLTPREFFNSASSFYDTMIGFDTALEWRMKLLKGIFGDENGLFADFGCGSGIDSLALAQLGNSVQAFDISEKMVASLAQKAAQRNLPVETAVCSLTALPEDLTEKFDSAVSLGNTLALLSPKELGKAFKEFARVLKDGSTLVIQVLNYKKILEAQQRIIGITDTGTESIIRFYDFYDTYLNFNILHYSHATPSEHELITTKLYPYTLKKIEELTEPTGLVTKNVFGSLGKGVFMPEQSGDLVLVFTKR